jgi:hypothetical protein
MSVTDVSTITDKIHTEALATAEGKLGCVVPPCTQYDLCGATA